MPLSRPSLAFAGGAAVVMVAVVVSHRSVVTPHFPSSEDAEVASEDLASTFQKGLSLPLPEVPEDEQSLAPAAGAPDESSPLAAAESAAMDPDLTPNPVKIVTEEPVSTFSIDIDTASYALVRMSLDDGRLPHRDAVRTEELVNYFPYDYAPHETRDPPFATHVSVMPAPWNDTARLMHIGITGHTLDLMRHQTRNGNAANIDSRSDARNVPPEEAASTLVTIAKDVKIQVKFNPAVVGEYRLIGYDTRLLAHEDFRDDKVGAGEIGAGDTVTAIYEFIPAGSDATRSPALRGQAGRATPATEDDGEFAFLKLRYKLPGAETSTSTTRAVTAADAFASVDDSPRDVRFAAAVAAFGELLRGGRHMGDYGYGDVVALAQGARGDDPLGYRSEFIRLVRVARSIAGPEE